MDKVTEAYCKNLSNRVLVIGVPNKSANEVSIKERTWSDCTLEQNYSDLPDTEFTKLVCKCKSTEFEVFITGDYETSVRCLYCHFWYVVHSG